MDGDTRTAHDKGVHMDAGIQYAMRAPGEYRERAGRHNGRGIMPGEGVKHFNG